MSEEELEKQNKEFFGYTMADIDEDLGRKLDEIYKLQQENQKLKEQLKQRDEVIEEAIDYAKAVIIEHENGGYDVSTVLLAIEEHKENIENILKILNELTKYKGDNK